MRWQRHSHVEHRNGCHKLAQRTFHTLGTVRVHQRHTAPSTIDVRHLGGFHRQVHGVAARALHAGGAAHVHQKSPASATNQLSHLCTVGRHLRYRTAKRAAYITGPLRIHEQGAAPAAYELSLLRLPSLHGWIWHHPIGPRYGSSLITPSPSRFNTATQHTLRRNLRIKPHQLQTLDWRVEQIVLQSSAQFPSADS